MNKSNLKLPLIVIYLLVGGMVYFGLSGKQALKDAQIATLNRIRPESFDPLIDFMKARKPLTEKEWAEYIFYYKKVSEYITPSTDMFGMLGFCYYAHGEQGKAITAYQKAIQLDP